mmetsp:Transcript_3258/g.11400  ORF Transcript_3258/g.11400 Transcript_3258/m.11400 type:complete len:275 (+) Transcript_3258:222-1046(+)
MSTSRPSLGTLPSTAQGASRAASVVSSARPLTRKVSVQPGTMNSRPICGFCSRLRSVSAMRLPGRSGSSRVRSSRMRTKPAGSPRGLRSQRPWASLVATATSGARSMNWRVRALSRSVILAQVSGSGSPIKARSSASLRSSWSVRRWVMVMSGVAGGAAASRSANADPARRRTIHTDDRRTRPRPPAGATATARLRCLLRQWLRPLHLRPARPRDGRLPPGAAGLAGAASGRWLNVAGPPRSTATAASRLMRRRSGFKSPFEASAATRFGRSPG